jgi:hypothetical protein
MAVGMLECSYSKPVITYSFSPYKVTSYLVIMEQKLLESTRTVFEKAMQCNYTIITEDGRQATALAARPKQALLPAWC